MRTKEQLEKDIELWQGVNKYIVREAQRELRELPKEVKAKPKPVEPKPVKKEVVFKKPKKVKKSSTFK